MKNVLIALALVAVFTQSTFAGGAKKDATIKAVNTTKYVAAVIVDPPAGFPAEPTRDQFLKAGGKFVQPGATGFFNVKAGVHDVYVRLVDEKTGKYVGALDSVEKTLAKGDVVTATVSQSAGGVTDIK